MSTRICLLFWICTIAVGLAGGCASGPGSTAGPPPPESTRPAPSGESAAAGAPAGPPPGAPATPAEPEGPSGPLEIAVENALGTGMPAKVELVREGDVLPVRTFYAETGHTVETCPVGRYTAYVYAYDRGMPYMAAVRLVDVTEAGPARVAADVLLGASGDRGLAAFDNDGELGLGDGVLDPLETELGTDPLDPTSYPGAIPIPWDERVLAQPKDGIAEWYRGELQAQSVYGQGTETVAQLVRRAEQAGLDFLAITDTNTMAAAFDPAHRSDRVALIPSLAWDTGERGTALLYGPRTVPSMAAETYGEVGNVTKLVQAQGGVFAIAHPCLAQKPWQWGVGYANAVQVWTRDWRAMPPVQLGQLNEDSIERFDGRLVHSIARAAATDNMSANGQAELFWDYELGKGLMAAPLAGSLSANPSVALGSPITYILAEEKSATGLLNGMLAGKTFVSRGLDGPQMRFDADVRNEGYLDVGMGGIVPVGIEIQFEVKVIWPGKNRMKGLNQPKCQILRNGKVAVTQPIEGEGFSMTYLDFPTEYTVYRARVIDSPPPGNPGYGYVDVYAMTSPIYAREMVFIDPQGRGVDDMWVRLQSTGIPPLYTTGRATPDGVVQIDPSSRRPIFLGPEHMPDDPSRGQIKPQFQF